MTGYGPPLDGDPIYVAEPYPMPPDDSAYGPDLPTAADRAGRNRLHPGDWLIVIAAGVVLLCSVFPYYTYNARPPARQACDELAGAPGSVAATLRELCAGDGSTAWHGVFGWWGVLLAVVGGCAAVAAALATGPRVAERVIGALAFGLAAISTIWAGVTVPDWTGRATLGIDARDYAAGVREGHGSAYWFALAAVLIGALASLAVLLRASAARRVGG